MRPPPTPPRNTRTTRPRGKGQSCPTHILAGNEGPAPASAPGAASRKQIPKFPGLPIAARSNHRPRRRCRDPPTRPANNRPQNAQRPRARPNTPTDITHLLDNVKKLILSNLNPREKPPAGRSQQQPAPTQPNPPKPRYRLPTLTPLLSLRQPQRSLRFQHPHTPTQQAPGKKKKPTARKPRHWHAIE